MVSKKVIIASGCYLGLRVGLICHIYRGLAISFSCSHLWWALIFVVHPRALIYICYLKTVFAILFFWSHSVHFHPKQHYQFTVTKWYLSSLRFISHFEHIPLVITCLNQIWHFVGDFVFGNNVHCSFHVLQGYLLFVVPEIVKVKRSIFYFLKALPNYDSIGALLSYPRRCSYIS